MAITQAEYDAAQSSYQQALKNATGGRLTQSQIEQARRYASSKGIDFDPNRGYTPKGYGKTPSPTSAQRTADRRARAEESGNFIAKGGAFGLAAGLNQLLGGAMPGSREADLRMKMMFSKTGLTDAEKKELGIQDVGRYYDNAPNAGAWAERQRQQGITVLTPAQAWDRKFNNPDEELMRQHALKRHYAYGGLLSDEEQQELTDLGFFSKERYEGLLGRKGYTAGNGQFMQNPQSQLLGAPNVSEINSALQGLSMQEKSYLSSNNLLTDYVKSKRQSSQSWSHPGMPEAYKPYTASNFGDLWNMRTDPSINNALFGTPQSTMM